MFQANMPVTRMRMRPWLEKMIESEKFPGLTWVDKVRTLQAATQPAWNGKNVFILSCCSQYNCAFYIIVYKSFAAPY